MSQVELPQPGETVLIVRPGTTDQEMTIVDPGYACWEPPPQDGWAYLFGYVLNDAGEPGRWPEALYARQIGPSRWEMVPFIPLPEPGPALAEHNRKVLEKRLGRPIGGEAR